jgi:hypothetical protein
MERGVRGTRRAIESEVRCGDAEGAPHPFIGVGGAPGRGGRELIADVNGFNAIEGVKAH